MCLLEVYTTVCVVVCVYRSVVNVSVMVCTQLVCLVMCVYNG